MMKTGVFWLTYMPGFTLTAAIWPLNGAAMDTYWRFSCAVWSWTCDWSMANRDCCSVQTSDFLFWSSAVCAA